MHGAIPPQSCTPSSVHRSTPQPVHRSQYTKASTSKPVEIHSHFATDALYATQACSLRATMARRSSFVPRLTCKPRSLSSISQLPLALGPASAYEAQAPEAEVEDKERVDSEADAVAYDARASEDADSGGERPEDKEEIDRYAHDGRHVNGRQQRCDDEREERVSNDTDALGKGAVGGVV